MIVYGDPQYETTSGALRARLRARLADGAGLDGLRSLLILAGQAEQAAADAGLPDAPWRAVTDNVASAFLAAWDGRSADVPPARERAARALDALTGGPDARVTVRLPEGFACYALYPEQYVPALRAWLSDRAGRADRRALVVGVRSIGTTLSALAMTLLAAHGWEARRRTVRPTGHPYDRRVDLRPEDVADAAWALAVDEGPGRSGSSLAAVAEALIAAGVGPDRVAFLPGHAGEPGGAASTRVRAIWAATPRYVGRADDLRWAGLSLTACLAARTAELCGEPVTEMADLGGGGWRRAVYADESGWPAVYTPFERPKRLCSLRGGGRVLWKFAGLADAGEGDQARAAADRQRRRARAGWCPPPLGECLGFVATPWVEGVALTRSDGDHPAILAHVGQYLAASAGPPLGPAEAEAAWTRLREMLVFNTREALGEAAAGRAERRAEAVGTDGEAPSAGDGRMAPHEWLRTPDGRIVKADAAGRDGDHTVVGRQPLAWDIAGALVEWGLMDEAVRPLLAALEAAGAPIPDPKALRFYLPAYAAFRLGQAMLCAEGAERARLERAADFYREALRRWLDPG